MGVNMTTIAYLRALIIEIGSTIFFNGGGSPGYVYMAFVWRYLVYLLMYDIYLPEIVDLKTGHVS